MKAVLLFISMFILTFGMSQGTVGYLFEDFAPDSIRRTLKRHTSLKPEIRLNNRIENNSLKLSGLADMNYIQSVDAGYKTGLGAEFKGLYYDKWYFRLAAIQGLYSTDSIYQPKSFIRSSTGSINFYSDIRSRVSFTPNHIFNFQAGIDHQFIGEGCRSLLLSDYGTPYPFAQIRARFWRLEYSVLYQFLREKANNNWESKFSSSHHISFNIAKWMNLGIFETVIFQPKDTLINRGFEVEYLNPVVFYRPQEYSLGSSDNVLLGAEISFFYKSHTLYSQFILDEFYLSELRAKSGWWANKFGGQIGVKGLFKIGKHELFYRTEYNFVRPYTYSHLNEELNYGNQGYSLAHPYGANFMEILGELKWQNDKWKSRLFLNYYLKGNGKNGYNFGGDIYQPYTNRPYEYGHYIGQGDQENGMVSNFMIAYEIMEHGHLSAFVENQLRYNVQQKKLLPVAIIGIRSLLWNDYRNY